MVEAIADPRGDTLVEVVVGVDIVLVNSGRRNCEKLRRASAPDPETCVVGVPNVTTSCPLPVSGIRNTLLAKAVGKTQLFIDVPRPGQIAGERQRVRLPPGQNP